MEVVTDLEEATRRVPQWDALAADVLEPNPYYESWMLLPAIRAFRPDFKDLALLLIYTAPRPKAAHTANGSAEPQLIGMFPFERRKRYRQLPLTHLTLWDYGSCYAGTPLIRRGEGERVLNTLWRWLESGRRGDRAFEFRWVPGEGPVAQALTDFCRVHVALNLQNRLFTRALLVPRESHEAYLKAALSANKRRDLARKERRLREMGTLSYDELEGSAHAERWIEEFLDLEASGWKGRQGTALATRPAHAQFFREMAHAAAARGTLWLSALRLDGRAIAMRCNLFSKPGSFFFKPAYDETLARHSPGVLLEVETIRRLHEMPDVHWMDSCTAPNNELLNALWLDRRIIQTIAWADYHGGAGLVLTAHVLFRWVRCRIGRSNENPVAHY